MKEIEVKTLKRILTELKFMEKAWTSHGMLDYDGFVEGVLAFMKRLEKEVKKR